MDQITQRSSKMEVKGWAGWTGPVTIVRTVLEREKSKSISIAVIAFLEQKGEKPIFMQIFPVLKVWFVVQLLFQDSLQCNTADVPSLLWETQAGCQVWYHSGRMGLTGPAKKHRICSQSGHWADTATTFLLLAPTYSKLGELECLCVIQRQAKN